MLDGLAPFTFREEHWERLDAVGTILDREPLADFDDERADDLLGRADVLVGHWGCPTLTADVLDRAPRLKLFAYAAGTVKWQVIDAVWERGDRRDLGRRRQRGPGRRVHGRHDRAGQQACPPLRGTRARPGRRRAHRRQGVEPGQAHRAGRGIARRPTRDRPAAQLRPRGRRARSVPRRDRGRPVRASPAWSSTSCARGATCSASTRRSWTRPGG